MTRDTRAMSQGFQVAAHQPLSAHVLSATVLENAIDTLASCTREAGSHLETPNREAGSVGTNVFIGQGRSSLWHELKDFIEDRLQLVADEFNGARWPASLLQCGFPNCSMLPPLRSS
jgi:hypothetical protein